MDHDKSIPEQLSFFDLAEGKGVEPTQVRTMLARRLDGVYKRAVEAQEPFMLE